ncbi:hydrogenase maturation protease [Rhodobacter lacus]|uniref:Hydrogenase maturation protease n=1 Tax=Rhodobacter lacus TaxID=1641972 RepID=A0ABW5A4R9_9RHOB
MRNPRLNPRVVILAWGNESRGDDGLGPRLASRIHAAGWPHVTLIEDFQLQVEHGLDLVGQDFVLFVDGGQGTPPPFFFRQTGPRRLMTHSSHGVGPEAVLEAYRQVMNAEPPPAFVLCMAGERFDLGEGLSRRALTHLAAAWGFLVPLLSWPDLAHWQSVQTGPVAVAEPAPRRPAAE